MPDENRTEPHIASLSGQSSVGAWEVPVEASAVPVGADLSRPSPIDRPAPTPPEQVIDRLSEAAQRIAEEEHTSRTFPRASRLAPIRDISADIQRESTPSAGTAQPPVGADLSRPSPIYRLVPAPEDRVIDDNTPVSGEFPNVANPPEIPPVGTGEDGRWRGGPLRVSSSPNFPSSQQEVGERENAVSARQMPDLWPWFLEADPEESDTDNWANRTDPLTLRHFPSSTEAARIEEEDIRRAMAEGVITAPLPKRRRTRSSRVRIIFALLAILAVLALVIDGVLLSVTLLHPHRNNNDSNGPATLTLSTPTASIGQKVTAHISHFAPSTRVLLTHDIEEPVQIATGSAPIQPAQPSGAYIKLDSNGNASVSILIDTSWGPGIHTLQAEDITTRYTASAQLQIVHAGETRPSHLLIDLTSNLLNMGADYQGANTIKILTLRNSGDGTPISWAASTNKSWLMISPTQGIFSDHQVIAVAVDRASLKPGNYTDGVLTISSNVGKLPPIHVEMSVKALPANPGPVLAVTPAVLSFTATDGGSNPGPQSLMISNPGTQPLHWSETAKNPIAPSNQNSLFHALGVQANWLSTNVTSGTVSPGASQQVQVNVNSRSLLPGTYTGTLVFSPNGGTLPGGQATYDKAQMVDVSLTVQPYCGLSTSTGSMSFTAVIGQSNPSNQTLGLSATVSCATPINWSAMSSASWLSVTPDSGHLNGSASAVTSVAVNASVLTPGTYNGIIAFLTGYSTQSVTVQLTVQPKPSAGAPIIALSGLTLNFSNTQGQHSPASQVVTIINNGDNTLYWNTNVTQIVPSWLGDSPTGGTIPTGQTGQLSVNVNTAGLSPGTYVGQIGLIGQDANGHSASGSPQTITVNLLILPPCTLAQPSSSSLVFNAIQDGANPGQQVVQITATGNCGWPLNWHASVSAGASWLKVTPASGSISVSGQPVNIGVVPDITGLQATSAPYTAQITITTTDSAGAPAQGSPQVFSASLNILQPCQLVVSPTSPLAFTAPNPPSQTVTLSEADRCALPVSWKVAGDSASSSWLTLSPTSGSYTGTGTFDVSVNTANLPPGTYTAQITISANDAGNNPLQGSGQTVTVNLTVPGFTVSGSAIACSDSACTNSTPLPGATLTVLNSASTPVATTTSDPSGNYTLLQLAPGTYTVTVSGTDSNGNHYTGTANLLVTADQANFVIKAF